MSKPWRARTPMILKSVWPATQPEVSESWSNGAVLDYISVCLRVHVLGNNGSPVWVQPDCSHKAITKGGAEPNLKRGRLLIYNSPERPHNPYYWLTKQAHNRHREIDAYIVCPGCLEYSLPVTDTKDGIVVVVRGPWIELSPTDGALGGPGPFRPPEAVWKAKIRHLVPASHSERYRLCLCMRPDYGTPSVDDALTRLQECQYGLQSNNAVWKETG
ncbi:uncharacterized protein EDB93DRAFT_1099512 [Suillus bovinus]|uniref:uncharacterized protein n=1 Tax=Suillus bovinus TaxID=48563 RepID=UPI001B880309|nr:uncharacterized protein EDB93DRAFT_1099512 [Suillus bovinus]KAG2160149.1 hypothetical protein EDB93DRAFT_1099512 [Suillus bovinus]